MAVTSLVFALGACSRPVQLPLTVGMNAWVGYDPLVLARDRGLLDAAQVKVVELATASETQRQLRNGLLDAGALTLDEVLRLRDGGLDLRIVAVLDASHGADLVLAAPHIDRVARLRGEMIAVEGTSVGALMLERMLQSDGLTRADVTVINMEASQHLAALQARQVAAVVSYAPMNANIEAAGFHPLFGSDRIPGEILDVLAVRAEVLERRPEAVDALLRAWERGLLAQKADPEAASALLARGTDLTPEAYQSVLRGLHFYSPDESLRTLSGDAPLMLRNAQTVANLLIQMGLLQRQPDWSSLIDTGPAERVVAGS